MPTPIPTPPSPPKIPTGRELFDSLMAHIEPELTSEGWKTLEEKYKNETPEERALRTKRYELAFERCQQAFDDYMETLDMQVSRYRREAFAHAEMEDRGQEEGFLNQLSAYFPQAA